MKHLLLLLVLSTGITLPAAQARQASTVAPTKPIYGAAHIYLASSEYCYLSLADGVTPTSTQQYLEQDGKRRRFADEAAALNFLYQLGWDVQPLGVNSDGSVHYFTLKRRTP